MVSRIIKICKNKAVLFTLLSGVASGINFISLIIFGRVFSVEDYGVVTTFQAFVSNVAVFMTPIQVMICKEISDKNREGLLIREYIMMAFYISIIECLALVIGFVPLMNYLHFVYVLEYVLFITLIFANNTYTMTVGMAQGRQDFILLGVVNILLYSVKMLIGIFLGLMGIGPMAVIIGFLVAEIICILLLLSRLRIVFMYLKKADENTGGNTLSNYLWVLVLYTIVSMYMNSGDLLLGNIYCSQREIGLYSVAINLAKISVFLIATPVATILLPKVVAYNDNKKRQRAILLKAESITLFISAAYGFVFGVFSGWIIPTLYGKEYADASVYVLPCILFSSTLGMYWVFYQYAVVTDIMKAFTVVSACIGALMIVFIICVRLDLKLIPVVMIIAMVLSVFSILCFMRDRI